ncbi:hypothetical protein J1N35_022230 [Gossypium stocksii]|uniref:Uncharacterized protein n=1 Tax=Gossypium stocksii TaxID=47602 RepID=A0A9D3VHC2_9ROSI|nr:hypothetical protein J1N35_022230 [Gossypium stocksii]
MSYYNQQQPPVGVPPTQGICFNSGFDLFFKDLMEFLGFNFFDGGLDLQGILQKMHIHRLDTQLKVMPIRRLHSISMQRRHRQGSSRKPVFLKAGKTSSLSSIL